MKHFPLQSHQVELLRDIFDCIISNKDQTHFMWWRNFDQLERCGFIERHDNSYILTDKGREALSERNILTRLPLS